MQCIYLKNTLPDESVFLIGEGKTLSYDYLQRRISTLLHGKEFTTHSIPKSLAKFGVWAENHTPFISNDFIESWMIDIADDHYDLDISKAKEVLKWQPQHSFRSETLPLMINELKQDPIAWYKKNNLEVTAAVKKKVEEEQLLHK